MIYSTEHFVGKHRFEAYDELYTIRITKYNGIQVCIKESDRENTSGNIIYV